ncbi:MAG: sensor histidine kinase [Acidimicrobiales bacterium]
MRVKAVGASALERIRRTPPQRVDAVLATFLVLTGLTTTNQADTVYEPRDGLAIVLILASTVPYYARRRAPLAVFAVSQTAIAAIFVLGYHGGALPLVLAVGTYTVGAYRPLREVVLAAALQNVSFVVMVLSDSPGFGIPQWVTSVPLYAATMLVGWTMQSRRLRFDALEREQGEASRRAAADERLRIAQELHDVVAHSLGVIAVQAGVGMHVIDKDPAEARRALEHISRTSRSSLAEIRRLLGLVRSGEPTVAYSPTPGLADLPQLVREVGDAGLPVDLDVADGAGELPPGVELAAYRIVQEALTNAVRHARAHKATVRIGTHAGKLHVVVSDDGSGFKGADRSGGTAWSACRSASRCTAGRWTSGPPPTVASTWTPPSPTTTSRCHDPGRRGRRPGSGAVRVLGAAQVRR